MRMETQMRSQGNGRGKKQIQIDTDSYQRLLELKGEMEKKHLKVITFSEVVADLLARV